MKAITYIFLGILLGLSLQGFWLDSAQAKPVKKLAIEENANLKSFKEFSQSCKSGKLKKEKSAELANTLSERMSEWDVSALLVMRQNCAEGDVAEMVLQKLSQDALMKHPKSLIQAMTEEKISHELLVKIADNNLADAKDCKEDCLKKETLAFEQRMEKISNLELNTQEREMRDRFLSEMRLAFGKLKEKKLN